MNGIKKINFETYISQINTDEFGQNENRLTKRIGDENTRRYLSLEKNKCDVMSKYKFVNKIILLKATESAACEILEPMPSDLSDARRLHNGDGIRLAIRP